MFEESPSLLRVVLLFWEKCMYVFRECFLEGKYTLKRKFLRFQQQHFERNATPLYLLTILWIVWKRCFYFRETHEHFSKMLLWSYIHFQRKCSFFQLQHLQRNESVLSWLIMLCSAWKKCLSFARIASTFLIKAYKKLNTHSRESAYLSNYRT